MPENVCRLSLRGMSPSIFDPYFLALERTPAVLRAWSAASRAFLPAREANSSIVSHDAMLPDTSPHRLA